MEIDYTFDVLKFEELRQENERLKDAIRMHREQKADDRCIEDDDRLYAVLNDGIKCDRRVGDKAAMLHNCERFINNRCESGKWPTYAQLEQRIKELEEFKNPEGPGTPTTRFLLLMKKLEERFPSGVEGLRSDIVPEERYIQKIDRIIAFYNGEH